MQRFTCRTRPWYTLPDCGESTLEQAQAGIVACGVELPQEQVFRQVVSPTGDAAGWIILFLEDCTPQKGPVLDQLIKDCLKLRRSKRDKVSLN